jgi:hypothetical protein
LSTAFRFLRVVVFVIQEMNSALPAGGSGSVSTSILAENLLAELSQSSADTSSQQPAAAISSVSGGLTATSWIKSESDDANKKADAESEANIGMTAAQLLSSCNALGEWANKVLSKLRRHHVFLKSLLTVSLVILYFSAPLDASQQTMIG